MILSTMYSFALARTILRSQFSASATLPADDIVRLAVDLMASGNSPHWPTSPFEWRNRFVEFSPQLAGYEKAQEPATGYPVAHGGSAS